MSKSSLKPWQIFAGAGATLLVLLVSLYVSFQRFRDLENANGWNIHTYQVLLESSHLMRGLVNVQSGTRGFLQTGDETFLSPYNIGREEFDTHYKKALALTRDNPTQQKRLQLLQRQYSLWLNGHINPLIQMRRNTPDTQRALRLAEPGVRKRKIIADTMRITVASIEKGEIELLQQRTKREEQLKILTHSALLINGAFALVLATGLSLLLASGARKLQSTNHLLVEQIAQKERAERDAEILSSHNEMILQSASDGIIGVNQTGKITFFNPAAEAVTGYSAVESIGKTQHDLLQFKRRDGSRYPIEESPLMVTLKNGKEHKGANEVFWRKNGTPVAIEFTSSPLVMRTEEEDLHDDGKRVGAVIVFRDISSRQKTEATVRELASIVQSSDDAIIGLTLDGEITRWNRAATKLYGYSEFEMIGQSMTKLIPPESEGEIEGLLDKVKARQPIERYEAARVRKDDKRIQVVLSLSPVLDENGQVIGASSIARQVRREQAPGLGETHSISASTVNGNDNRNESIASST